MLDQSVLIAAVVASTIVFVAPAHGQTATLSGTVVRDSLGHEVAGAEVMLPDLNRSTKTNYLGEFRIGQLPAGRHALMIRQVGFAMRYDTIQVAEGARIDREFILSPMAEAPTKLEEVRVTAPERKFVSPGLAGFEERRKAGAGHFIVEDVMRKNDERNLIDVITALVPGISRMRMRAGSISQEYISSGRKCGPGPAFLSCRGGGGSCPPTLYVNGAKVYDASIDPDPRLVPDLSRYPTREYAAVEFYAGGASIPVQYNATSSGCGVLLLWTRER